MDLGRTPGPPISIQVRADGHLTRERRGGTQRINSSELVVGRI